MSNARMRVAVGMFAEAGEIGALIQEVAARIARVNWTADAVALGAITEPKPIYDKAFDDLCVPVMKQMNEAFSLVMEDAPTVEELDSALHDQRVSYLEISGGEIAHVTEALQTVVKALAQEDQSAHDAVALEGLEGQFGDFDPDQWDEADQAE